jgi:ubiquinone/menaquinone biosynthesis C-methylase UbiE
MLEMGRVGKNDVVYDLGCGDGRIVVTAAKERGARGVGIDLNPERIAEANANARTAGVTDRVRFMVGDLFAADFAPATVVTLYLLPDVNLKLRPQLWRQLKPGTRVVSHAFDMGTDWPPEDTQRVGHNTVYRWTIRKEHKAAAGRGT